MFARLIKTYCYRGSEKQIWFETEDATTGQGISWSPSREIAMRKATKLGYEILEGMLLKFYRANAS